MSPPEARQHEKGQLSLGLNAERSRALSELYKRSTCKDMDDRWLDFIQQYICIWGLKAYKGHLIGNQSPTCELCSLDFLCSCSMWKQVLTTRAEPYCHMQISSCHRRCRWEDMKPTRQPKIPRDLITESKGTAWDETSNATHKRTDGRTDSGDGRPRARTTKKDFAFAADGPLKIVLLLARNFLADRWLKNSRAYSARSHLKREGDN